MTHAHQATTAQALEFLDLVHQVFTVQLDKAQQHRQITVALSAIIVQEKRDCQFSVLQARIKMKQDRSSVKAVQLAGMYEDIISFLEIK